MANLKEIIQGVQDNNNKARLDSDFKRFLLYNGKLRDVIKEAITKEFKKTETIEELISRIIPINITQKIVNKLAGVYLNPPVRSAIDDNPTDDELISLYTDPFKIDQKMKMANRYFKLLKHVALEPFLSMDGKPRLRVLASHQYTLFSEDPVEPDRPTVFVKHLVMHQEKSIQRFSVWTKDTFHIVDGEGNVAIDEMIRVNNPDGINPFGRIPFTYISEDTSGTLIPIPDDDLISMQIAIGLLLTDLAFASKYQLWSVIAVTGAEVGNLTFNPSSIVELPAGASVDVIKPELDSDKALRMVESLLAMLLSTKNLSVGEVSGTLQVSNAPSGIAKMLDQSESMEDRKDQEAFFSNGEKDLWDLWSHHMLPFYVQQGLIDPKYVGAFSDQFELKIKFGEHKPMFNDEEIVKLELLKLDNGLTTQVDSLIAIDPDLDQEMARQKLEEIQKEKVENVRFMQKNFQPRAQPAEPGQPPQEDELDADQVEV